jgi:hypothetical protein
MILKFNKYITENRNSILKLEYHSGLSKKVWKDDKLRPELRQPLLDFAREWMEFARLPLDSITDITLTGGMANFNYTSLSDLDLHIIVDEAKLPFSDTEFAHEYIMDKKNEWSHTRDSKLAGFPVEIYAQQQSEPFSAGGVYSITNNKWVRHPKNLKLDFSHRDDLVARVIDISSQIENINDLNTAVQLKEFIRDLRSQALRDGDEFSDGNLVFKSLRNRGDLDKLSMFIKNNENV